MEKKSAPGPFLEWQRTSGIETLRDPHRDELSPASGIVPGFDGTEPTSRRLADEPSALPVIGRRDRPARRPPGGDARLGNRRFLLYDILLTAGLVVTVVISILSVVRPHVDQGGSGRVAGGSAGIQLLDLEPPRYASSVGSYTESRITSGGEVRVTQWIRSQEPLTGIRLRMRRLPGTGVAQATDVLVAADRLVLDEPKTLGPSGRRISFDAPTRVVRLSYTLTGVVERSSSVPGRALARATSLAVSYTPRTGPARVSLISHQVLSTSCEASDTALPRPCGAPRDGHWSVVLRGAERDDSVAAQVNLE